MYSKMTPQQISAYLKRIKIEKPEKLTLDYLTALQMAHVSNIPFENLDFKRDVPVELDRQHLYEKIIKGMRGGVCSEVNTLYTWLLESLGYDVISFSSRIIAESAPVQAKSHRIMGVKINDSMYITDVGKNAENHRIPLILEENTEQSDRECTYKFTRDEFFGWVLWQERPGMGWRRKLGFTEDIAIDADFIGPTMFAQYHPSSFLNKHANVSLYINGTFHALRGGYYLQEHGGIEEIICEIKDDKHESKLLKEIFNLQI